MKQEELCRKLTEMIAETKAQKLSWRLEVQTTEGNDASEKPIEEEHGTKWTIDECYASYSCNYRGKEFCMITYELLKKSGDKERSSNLVFLPPEGIRFFDLHTLLPYSVEMSAVLADHIHQLWLLLMEQYKEKCPGVELAVCALERLGDALHALDDIHGLEQERVDLGRIAHQADDRLVLAARDVGLQALFLNPADDMADGLVAGALL